MMTNRAGLTTLIASGLLMMAVPAGTGDAASLSKPPMPCVALRAGVLPGAGGFCPDTYGAIDWNRIERKLRALAGGGTGATVSPAPITPDPT
jgi:hypothetical protein